MTARSLGLALLLPLVAVAPGCGSGDAPDPGAGPASTGKPASPRLARFAAESAAICARRNEEVRRAAGASASPASVRRTAVARVHEVTLPIVTEQVSELRALDIPLSQFSQVEAALAGQEEAVIQLEGLREVRSFEILEIHFADADRMWRAYGLEACAIDALGR